MTIGLRHVLSWPMLGLEPKFHDPGTFGGFVKRAQSLSYIQLIFNTGPYGDHPLKIKISKIWLRSDLSWPKLGLEPKFHDHWTFGGFVKLITNRLDSCFISIDVYMHLLGMSSSRTSSDKWLDGLLVSVSQVHVATSRPFTIKR